MPTSALSRSGAKPEKPARSRLVGGDGREKTALDSALTACGAVIEAPGSRMSPFEKATFPWQATQVIHHNIE
jgi:hypothetical protein